MREEYDAKDEKKDRGPRKGGARRSGFRKKVCRFCGNNAAPDYKNPDQLKRYTTERGKILPARITGNCAKHQRAVTAEIKKARILGYLPFEKK
ncbi:MAG: 30S ribosomal protein S18 [Spirochaetia bacterium]|nr:30S ribosomal protein S18 [Spirochaetia bacterium]